MKKAGGVGINIPAANRVVIFDTGFNPTYDMQAVGRAYRYGQKKRTYVYRLCTVGTCEAAMQKLNVQKGILFDHVVERKNTRKEIQKNSIKYYVNPDPTVMRKTRTFDSSGNFAEPLPDQVRVAFEKDPVIQSVWNT